MPLMCIRNPSTGLPYLSVNSLQNYVALESSLLNSVLCVFCSRLVVVCIVCVFLDDNICENLWYEQEDTPIECSLAQELNENLCV